MRTELRSFGAGLRGFGAGFRGFGARVRSFGVGVRGFGVGVRGFGVGVRGFGVGVRGFGAGVQGFGTALRVFGAGTSAGFHGCVAKPRTPGPCTPKRTKPTPQTTKPNPNDPKGTLGETPLGYEVLEGPGWKSGQGSRFENQGSRIWPGGRPRCPAGGG